MSSGRRDNHSLFAGWIMCCLDSPRDTMIPFVALCLSTAEVIEVMQNTLPFSLSLSISSHPESAVYTKYMYEYMRRDRGHMKNNYWSGTLR